MVSSFTIYYINALLFHVSSFTVYYINAFSRAVPGKAGKAGALPRFCKIESGGGGGGSSGGGSSGGGSSGGGSSGGGSSGGSSSSALPPYWWSYLARARAAALVIKAEDCLYSKANACSKTCMNVLTLHVSSSTIYCMNALLFHVSSFTIYYMNALVIKANNPLFSRANACCKHLFYIS
jgi:hypothetical protein